MPHEKLEAALRRLHQSTMGEGYDEKTQAEVGKKVAAKKTVTTRIIKISKVCRVDLTLYDIGRNVSLRSRGVDGACGEDDLVRSLRQALASFGSTSPPPTKPLTVGVQPWGGYIGGPYFNGGLEPSAQSRFRTEYGLDVRFKPLYSIDESVRAWTSGEVDVMWITVDDLPTEYSLLRAQRPIVFMLAGWSRGEEVLVVRSNTRDLNDLKHRRVALEKNTSAHSFFLISLDLAGLPYDHRNVVAARDSGHAADLFIRGDVDAAVVWIPDDQRCLDEVRGAKVLESTKEASFLIAESLVIKVDTLRTNREGVRKLTEGWLRANAEINENRNGERTKAADLLVKAFGKSKRLAAQELATVRLATRGDNLNFFGLNRNYLGEKGQDLYAYFRERYGIIDRRLPPQPSWASISDSSLIAQLPLTGRDHRAEDPHDFAYCQDAEYQRPLSKKPLNVTFTPRSAKLNPDAIRDIDNKFGHLAEIYFEDCIRVDGNTDSRGGRAYNMKLSRQRAEAVKAHLVERYGFDHRRIITVGNGPDKPVATNKTRKGRKANRRTDFELLHREHRR